MKRPRPLHPFLFAAFPVLSIWSANVYYVPWPEVARVLGVALALAAGALLVARPLTRSWIRAGLPATAIVAGFFTYDALYRWLLPHALFGVELGRHRNLGIVLGVAALGVVWFARRLGRSPERLTRVLNTVGAVMVTIPVLTAVWGLTVGRAGTGLDIVINADFDPAAVATPDDRPDVFHIVLDGYARSDVLRRVFDVDDEPFLKALEDRGFYVAREAIANYPYTPLSFSAMFHMSSLDPLMDAVDDDQRDFLPINHALVNNPVWDTFEHLGYETYAFSSGHGWTQFRRADVWLSPGFQFSEFEQRIASLGPTKAVFDRVLGHSVDAEYRQRVRYALRTLPALATRPSPKYVFAHVACPHPPYAFNADGSDRRARMQEYWWHDPEIRERRERGERIEEIVDAYAAQARYVAAATLDAIDAILERSPRRPVILLHSDHGSDSRWHRADPNRADLQERFGILQAFLVDEETRALLHPRISPVNTFRALFTGAFGQDLPLVPDRAWYVPLKRPYAPVDVTDRLGDR